MNAAGWVGTLTRYALLLGLVICGMVLLHRLLRRLGCRDRTAAGYAFILPWLAGAGVFWLVPMAWSLYLSATRYEVLSPPEWVGLQNFTRILTEDPVFREAAWNTISFAALSVSLGIVSSLAAAMLLSLDARLMGFWRAVYYLPSVIPAVSTALLWRWIFVSEGGLANAFLEWLGLPQPGWFSDPDWVIPAFVIMGLQGACGNNMVIFLAKLKGIDGCLYEAASLDGAGWWSRFRHVTLPQLSPLVFYHLVMGIIGGLQVFTQPMFVRTPGRSGLFYSIYIYRTGLHEFRMGYACALSWVLFAALLALTALVFRSARFWVSYEESDIRLGGASQGMAPRGARRRVWIGVVVIGAAVMLAPILWMISTSLKSAGDLFSAPPELLSLPLRWGNYPDAWRALPFGRFLVNTLLLTGLAMGGEVLMALLVAYGFARFRFPGRRLLFGVLLSTMLVPGMVMMIPVFLIWRKLGLVGTFDPLVLGCVLGGPALFVFIAHQFLRTLPSELEEAARLDGASHARVFFSIILPLTGPVLLVLSLISFQSHWNDFLGPLLYLNRMEQYTMTLGLHFFQGAYMGEAPKWHWMMAMTTMMAVPTVVLFALTQRVIFSRTRAGK
jgi:ABC-type sugar transport system permease subunit